MNATSTGSTAPSRLSATSDQAPTGGTDMIEYQLQPRPHVFDLVGGWRGAVDGGLPPLVFVVVNAIAGAHGSVRVPWRRRSPRPS